MTHFILIFALLQWFGTKPTISPRYVSTCLFLSRESAPQLARELLPSLPLGSGWPFFTSKYRAVISSPYTLSILPLLSCSECNACLHTLNLPLCLFPVYLYKCVSSMRAGTVYCVSPGPQCQRSGRHTEGTQHISVKSVSELSAFWCSAFWPDGQSPQGKIPQNRFLSGICYNLPDCSCPSGLYPFWNGNQISSYIGVAQNGLAPDMLMLILG